MNAILEAIASIIMLLILLVWGTITLMSLYSDELTKIIREIKRKYK